MSKFEQLCYTYNRSHSEMSDYLESCVQFIENLITGLEAYLECPAKRVNYRNKEGEETNLRESMYLENGFWHFDTAITMCPESAYRRRAATFARCYYPRQTVVLPFVIKRVNADSFVVGIDSYPEYFTVNINEKNSFDSLYEFLFESIHAYYKNIFHFIMESGVSPTKIEFSYVKNHF